MSRRHLLRATALAAGGVALAGCSGPSSQRSADTSSSVQKGKGSATEPLSAPAEFAEAPSLSEQVQAGSLPPLKKRLPAHPYVVPHNWLEEGNFGGTLRLVTPSTADTSHLEYMYGHSPLRYLNDSADIGPGLVDRWDSNADASEWRLHFREGLRWSDGHPCTTEDVLFWWEDMVLDDVHPAVAGPDAKSANGTVAKISAEDEQTLVVTFDSPMPMFSDHLATWVNRGNGSSWIEPKHYLKQFHPRYNKSVDKSDWIDKFERQRSYWLTPESPTMTGWRLKSYSEGRSVVWERNPYYWCLDKQGNQLPYIDEIAMEAVTDPKILKLQVNNGQVDYVHGPFTGLSLTDVSALQDSRSTNHLRLLLWNSGSGTGSMLVFNYDHPDPQLRKLFREPKFRQAMSLAFDREKIRKTVYFGKGRITTGTMSPRAMEYHAKPGGPRSYENWRKSFADYDPERAKQLLDELGVVDTNGDGLRELPDGSTFAIRFDYPADLADEHRQKNEQLKRDWKKVGVDSRSNPLTPSGFTEQWRLGTLMTDVSRIGGDGPNHVTYPSWLVPTEPGRFAPLQGQQYVVRGTPDENSEKDVDPWERQPPRLEPEPGDVIDQLWKLYDRAKVEPDPIKRNRLVYDLIKIHIEKGPFFMGSVADTPQVIAAHEQLRNVPARSNLAQGGYVNPWIHPTPAVYDPETWFWANPSDHET